MLVVLGLILSAHCKRATLSPPTSSCGAEAGIRKTAGTCKQREWGQTPGQRLPIGLGKHHSSLSSFVNQRTELLFGSFRDAWGVAWKYFWPVGDRALLRLFIGMLYKIISLTFAPLVNVPLFKLVLT